MVKEKDSPKKWLINDVFYVKVDNDKSVFNGKYLIFVKCGNQC